MHSLHNDLAAHIRWMIRRDMPEVLNIENEGFGTPWTEEDFISYLQRKNCIGMVAEHEDRVVGFMIYGLHKRHMTLHNLAVAADFRGRSIGTQFVLKLQNKLSPQRRCRIVAYVNEDNVVAHCFLKGMCFRAVAIERKYFANPTRDAYRMEYRMPRLKKHPCLVCAENSDK